MSDTVAVRPVEAAELPKLLTFARETFLASYAHLNTPENMAMYVSRYFTPEQFAAEFCHPESAFYCAEADGVLLGYLKLNWGAAQTEVHLPDDLEIERIYVAPGQQGKGIGGALLAQAHAKAREIGCTWIWLGVWEENPRAIRFYERNGFRAFGTHVFKLGEDPQVDVLMRTRTPD